MAPVKKSIKGTSTKGGKSGGSSKKSAKPRPTGSAPEGISKKKQKSMSLAKPGGEQKKKSTKHGDKRKKRVYTEKELDIPQLNGIVPAGIAKPKGQKKGKKFVDDPVSMMAIMSMVNAEKDKDVESRIMRARQLEEVREAKRKEAESRAEEKASAFEDTKNSLKKKKGKKGKSDAFRYESDDDAPKKSAASKKKKVSFG